jgi:hypothetical protein
MKFNKARHGDAFFVAAFLHYKTARWAAITSVVEANPDTGRQIKLGSYLSGGHC